MKKILGHKALAASFGLFSLFALSYMFAETTALGTCPLTAGKTFCSMPKISQAQIKQNALPIPKQIIVPSNPPKIKVPCCKKNKPFKKAYLNPNPANGLYIPTVGQIIESWPTP